VTLALFRIIEADHGNIVVDDVDISEIALYPLRSKIVILPQVNNDSTDCANVSHGRNVLNWAAHRPRPAN